MLKSENHILQVEIPRALFAELKMMSLNGRYKGVKEMVKPYTDQLVSDLVEYVNQQKTKPQTEAPVENQVMMELV